MEEDAVAQAAQVLLEVADLSEVAASLLGLAVVLAGRVEAAAVGAKRKHIVS